MKKDRKHQLAQNSLAKWIERNIEALKPHSSLISGTIIGILLIVLVFAVWQMFSRGNKAGFSQDIAATVLYGIQEPSEIDPMLIKYPKGDENAQFHILAGEVLLRKTESLLATKREEAIQNLQKALESFQQAHKSTKVQTLTDRTLWGQGRTYEILAAVREGTDLNDAKKCYEQLAGNDASVYQQLSKDRLDILNRSWTPIFLAKSVKFQPPQDIVPNIDPTVPEPGSIGSEVDQKLGLDPAAQSTETPEEVVVPETPVEPAEPVIPAEGS